MSSAPDPHGHDVSEAHAFTGEPVQVLPPDEPRTPGWVPLLGLALFTGAAIVLLASHGAAGAPDGAAVADAAITAVAVKPEQEAKAPAPQPRTPPPAPPPRTPPPLAAVRDAASKLTPEQMAQVRKNVEKAGAKGLLPRSKQPAK
jgi:hypothetical protein